MPYGRDSVYKKNWSPNEFLISKEMMRVHRDWARVPMKEGEDWSDGDPKLKELRTNKGLLQSLDNALIQTIQGKSREIDQRWGLGASDWLQKNLEQFTPEDRFRLYDMFDYMPRGAGSPYN